MTIDPRLAERRQTVAEDRAKRNVGRLLKFLVAVVVVGSVVWLALSPWLSVSRVETTGIDVSSGHAILAGNGVVAGTPMIMVDAGVVEEALLEDPWIAEAEVVKDWPDRVAVNVVERSPVAWTRTKGGWTRRAIDGVALPSASEPDDEMATIDMRDLADVAAITSPDMI
ncbi:MAG TPA: FtsQ-type POTRA domain-containing protein, partial [Acidimicrobiia bacterium]|nr:FtsQ-type POTRA domain-containing protein [Acidimicrobiia bacterium]